VGTRADFYVGSGVKAEWLGSIAWDGYPDGIDAQVLGCQSEAAFRHAVADFLANREDGTTPDKGWPWPWDDSRTTDYAYCFETDHADAYCFGRPVSMDRSNDSDDEEERPKRADWPDMSAVKKFTMGQRSGVIVLRA
jgi:hypothetical protein